jgi:sugar lactone lactonase YvrE
MPERHVRPRRLGVASLASMAVVAALSVATPTALTAGAHAATGSRPHRSAVVPNRPAVRHLSASLPHESVASAVVGTVYVADYSGQVLAIAPDGTTSQVGTGWSSPMGVAVDSAGNLFVTDGGNGTLVELAADGTQTTLASGFGYPIGVAVDTDGNVYVGDNGSNRVVEVAPNGDQTVLPFEGLSCPNGIAVDAQGDVYATDFCSGSVSELTPGGAESTVGSGYSNPTGVAVDSDGNVFVADIYNNRVEKVAPGGTQTTVPNSDTGSPTGVEVDADGNVYIADLGGGNYQLTTDGGRTTLPSTNAGYDIGVLGSRTSVLPQTISFSSDAPTGALPGDDYTVSADGGDSGNPVTFSTQSDGVCSVSDNGDGTAYVSLDHAGDCVLDADQAGNGDYADATTAHQTVTVDKFAQSVHFTSAPGVVRTGDTYDATANGGESGNPVTFAVDPSTASSCTVSPSGEVTFLHATSCAVVASQAGNGDFLAGSATQTVKARRAFQTVVFTSDAPHKAHAGTTYHATATGDAASGRKVRITGVGACSVGRHGLVTFTHRGSCAVFATQSGNADYQPGKAKQFIEVTPAKNTRAGAHLRTTLLG